LPVLLLEVRNVVNKALTLKAKAKAEDLTSRTIVQGLLWKSYHT